MQITELELRAMTRDLDDMHHETLPKMQAAITELREGRGTSRRGFLFGAAGLTAGALIVAACGSDKSDKGATTVTSSSSSDTSGKLTGDLAIAALAASPQNLAVQ